MQKEKKLNGIGLGYLIAAAVFLFNPNISVIDVLPDFIGYFLFTAGLAKIADIMPRFADVKETFGKLAWISLAKFFSVIFIFIMPLNEQATFGLVLTFSFAVIDLIYLIPAWNGFFDGVIYLGTRYDSKAVFYSGKGKKTQTETLKRLTLVFFVLKEIIVIMPELTSLSSYESLGYVDYHIMDIHHFQPHFRVLSALVIVVLGIVWLYKTVSYFNRLGRDKAFISALISVYETEVLPDTDLFTRRRIKTALVVLCFAFGFGVDFYIYDVNFIPDVISAALFVVGFALLYKHVKRSLPAAYAGVFYGIVSLFQLINTIIFFDNFDITHIDKDYDVYLAYTKVTVGAIIESLVFVAFMVFVFSALKELVREHTGYVAENGRDSYSMRSVKEEKRLLFKGLSRGMAAAVLAAFSNVAYYVLSIELGFFWMINLAIAAICAAIWVTGLNNVYEQVEDRYLK